jgi:hypothetical protein
MSGFSIRADCNQVAIEARLAERLQEAKAAFDSSTVQFKQIIEDCKALRMNSTRRHGFQPNEDRVTVKESLIIHRDAIVKYRQAFEDFSNFLLHGQLPEHPDHGSQKIPLKNAVGDKHKTRRLPRETLH